MKTGETYIAEVVQHVPPGALRAQIEAELRSHIADRIERGGTVEEAIRQLGDPRVLAESYLASVPLVSAPVLRRGAAKLVDLVIMYTVPCLFVWLGVLSARPESREPSDLLPIILAVAAFATSVVGACLYPVIAEYSSGQTLGKMLFGLRVVTEKGARITLGQAFLRSLPIYIQIFMVDALFALFTEKKQRAFELISKTRVVDAQEPARPGDVVLGIRA